MISTLVLALLSVPQGPTELTPVQASLPGAVDEVHLTSPGDMLVHGGAIYLGGAENGVAEAMWIRDGRVVETGDLASIEALTSDSEPTVIDLRGAVVVPGFQLAKVRALRLALNSEALDLSGAQTPAELLAALSEFEAETAGRAGWVLGVGLESHSLHAPDAEGAEGLGGLPSEAPMLLLDEQRNVALLNRAGLERMGWIEGLGQLSKSLLAQIELDEELLPTGWVRGEALDLVRARLEASLQESERDRLMLVAQSLLLGRGWTSIHDVQVSLETLASYERLRDRGLLRLRVAAYLSGNGGVGPELVSARDRVASTPGRLTVAGVAFRLDGPLASREAAMLTPYLESERDSGRLLLSEEALTASINDCYHAGLQPIVLAVGDRATRVAMRVFRTMLDVDEGFASLRPRVVGAEVVSTQDIPQFPGMKIYPTLRAGFEVEDVLEMEALLDSARLASAIEWNSIAPSLRNFAFEAELDGLVPDPISTLLLARTYERKSRLPGRHSQRGETLVSAVALRGLTLGPAAALNEEELRGELTDGAWADFTILDSDPLGPLGDDAPKATALMTVIAGQVTQLP